MNTQGDLICLVISLCFSSWFDVTVSLSLSRPSQRKKTTTKGYVFFPSSCLPFLPITKSQFWKRRSEPVSSQCTVMQQLHQRLFLCANVLPLFNVQLVCFPGWPIKSPSGMLMSSTLLLNIPQGLYELCVQQSRGSLVMGLTRLAENMMGVLMCWQVVLLNDG